MHRKEAVSPHDNSSVDRDSNTGTRKYEAGVPTIRRSDRHLFWVRDGCQNSQD